MRGNSLASVLTVILNWRTADMTLRAAEAARAAMQGISGAITIVDNASGDGSFDRMSRAVQARGWDKGETPVRVLQSGQNGGFGAGNNHGIRAGLQGDFPAGQRPDYVYVLNSDAFPEPGAIRTLLGYLEAHPEAGFAGSYIYGEDGAAHQTAFRFPSVAGEFESHLRLGLVSRLLRHKIVAMPVPQVTARAGWMAGASLMLRQDMLDQIGLFDERFFLYFEETDLMLRGARAGWQAVYLPESRVMHIGSVSTGMRQWQRLPGFWLDSRLHYFTKNHGRSGAIAATLAAALGGGLWRARLLVQTKERGDPPYYLRDMLKHHFRRRFRPLPEAKNAPVRREKA
ncbi:glycosyltransferase family 2 protein [Pseudogemmobacter sp. CC-YST710]|uniref:Glycosyltransferase family 2 protein n=1 Tax=Pseudogemmobacter faecipullorum TaxID=2755041 RepID=A0ABS8CI63_9RHOB|nr:glycosyltransferase family 2 protein [Pseudogemmobacter faecipullorum]